MKTSESEDLNKHYCDLGPESHQHKDIVKVVIETGMFVELRRKLRRFTMISPNHPLTSTYIRSTYQRYIEEKKHMLLSPYMIHPFSMFSLWFHILMNTCFLYIFIPFYYQMVINRTLRTVIQFYCVSLPFYVPLMIVSFLTGYHDRQENRVILSIKSVCWRYVSTYLIFDVLYVSGIFFVIWYYHLPRFVGYLALFALTACTFARYPYFHEGCKLFKMYIGMDINTYSVVMVILTSLVIFLFTFAYLFYQVRQHPKWPWYTTISKPRLSKIQWLLELRRLFAFVEVIMMVGHAHNNLSRPKKAAVHYTTDLLPIIFIPLGFVFMLALAVREKKLNTMLSEKLQKDILLKATKTKLEQVEFFRNLPEKALRKIMKMMKLEFYMPGDAIIKAGATGTCMFFISVGTVLVTTRNGKEVCILKDGAQIGEIALITKAERVANVTAVTPCELYRLKRQHFQQVMKKYPLLLEKMREQAFGRIANTKSLAAKSSSQRIRIVHSADSSDFENEESDEEMLAYLL